LKAVGFSASPADGLPDIVAAVDYVCQKKGGEGAVREIIEMILAAQRSKVESGKWKVEGLRSGKRS